MEKPNWDKRRLGRTELLVTPLGIGGAYLGRTSAAPPNERALSEQVAVETVLRGLELGLNLIDTSPKYLGGVSERFVGLALQEWYRRGGKREDLVLSTKVGSRVRPHCYTYDHAMDSIETSLELLQEDYVDLMLVHDPGDMEPVFASGGALVALKELQAQGVIGHIGLGCRPHAFHRRCIESGDFAVSLTFGDYNLLRQSAAQGDPIEHAHRIWAWCNARGVSMLALNLQYSLREPRIASTLIGFSRPSRVDEDIAAVLEPLDASIWQELTEEFGL